MNKPELLAPAGGRDALIAAIQSGADAVYLGAGSFNARQSADNFDGNALASAICYAHERNTRVHVTLNTLVREDEQPALIQAVEQIASAGADAVLVQDFGVAKLVREIAPELPLHASTQMAVHNRAAVEFLAKEGFARAVLAREMTLDEIRACANLGIETEVFVHGALCVACSGQCLFSSLVGGRSGNRGRCAQPCRLPYRMDGREGYLLSTRDLCAIEKLDALAEAGVASLKIEGRLKRPEYVSTVVRAYRSALDHKICPNESTIEFLGQMFNRGGFTEGYLPGVTDSQLIYAARPNHIGVTVGKCSQSGKICLTADLDPADVLALRNSSKHSNIRAESAVQSSTLRHDCMENLAADRPVKLSGRAGETTFCPDAKKGDCLIRLVSERQMQDARAFCAGEHRAECLNAHLKLRIGQRIELTVSDGALPENKKSESNSAIHTVTAFGDPVERAQNRGVDPSRVRAQLEKTGGTAYCMDKIELDMDSDAFCPVSALNAIRRDALDQLSTLRQPKPYALQAPKPLEPIAHSMPKTPEIMVESANPAVLRRAMQSGASGAIFSPEDVRMDALNAALEILPEKFFLAPPMVLGERSLKALNAWANAHSDRLAGVYLTNIGQFNFPWHGEIRADFSLNAANRKAVRQLREWGANRIAPSVELTAGQIALMDGALELIVHGYLPLMQLRHCPYRTTHNLPGKHESCRRCDSAPDPVTGKTLVDRTGAQFALRRVATDEGCIVRIMNSVPLMLLKRANRLPKADAWRIMTEDEGEVESLIRLYSLAARNADFKFDPDWTKYESLAATTGHFFRGVK